MKIKLGFAHTLKIIEFNHKVEIMRFRPPLLAGAD